MNAPLGRHLAPRWRAAALALHVVIPSTCAIAQEGYPSRPVKIIAPQAPGGGVDLVARIMAERLGRAMGQTFIVDNQAGVGGAIAAQATARAQPDGYTLMIGYVATHGTNPAVRKSPYDPVRDFTPIAMLGGTPNLLVVSSKMPVNTLQEFVVYAKANPTKVNFASAAVASPGHLSGELLNLAAGIHMQHVPYKGAGQAVVDLVGGQVQVMVSGMSAVMPHIKAGRLRPLAVTGARRSPAVPEVPTIAESGFPKFEATAWYGVLAPAGTAPAIVTRLNTEILRALKLPDVKERLEYVGFEIVGSTPAAFGAYIKSEIIKWAPVVKAAGVKPE